MAYSKPSGSTSTLRTTIMVFRHLSSSTGSELYTHRRPHSSYTSLKGATGDAGNALHLNSKKARSTAYKDRRLNRQHDNITRTVCQACTISEDYAAFGNRSKPFPRLTRLPQRYFRIDGGTPMPERSKCAIPVRFEEADPVLASEASCRRKRG